MGHRRAAAPHKGCCATEWPLRHRRVVVPQMGRCAQKGCCATEGPLRHRRAVVPQKGCCATEGPLRTEGLLCHREECTLCQTQTQTHRLPHRPHLESDSATEVLRGFPQSFHLYSNVILDDVLIFPCPPPSPNQQPPFVQPTPVLRFR